MSLIGRAQWEGLYQRMEEEDAQGLLSHSHHVPVAAAHAMPN